RTNDQGKFALAFLAGDGAGSFDVAGMKIVAMDLDDHGIWVLAGDWNGDKKLDLVQGSRGGGGAGTFGTRLGNGDGTFQPIGKTTSVPMNDFLRMQASGDFNGDKKLDVVIVDDLTSSIFVALGNGDGSFKDPSTYSLMTPYIVS